MKMMVDHYAILGLPSGVHGANLSPQSIIKAYKFKALLLHPDKKRDDPNAHKNFQRLLNSYEILKDKKSRKVYDDLVRLKHEKFLQELKLAHLKKKELAEKRARDEEEQIARKLKAEIAKIRGLHANKATHAMWKGTGEKDGQIGLEKENMRPVPVDVVFPIARQYAGSQSPELSASVGTDVYQAYESLVFAKLRRKAAERE